MILCLNKVKLMKWIKQNGFFYLLGFLTILGFKYIFRNAGSDELRWILAPTTGWVRFLSGIPFTYAPQSGYVSHDYRFIIAPACSGLQFMLITIATLTFSFIPRMNTRIRRCLWFTSSMLSSYLVTIFINGLRIILAIFLPLYLQNWGGTAWFLTSEQLHTCIGVTVYLTALFIIYRIGGCFSQMLVETNCRLMTFKKNDTAKYLLPLFWYFFIALGIPFLNRANENNGGQFREYALLVSTVSAALLILIGLGALVFHRVVKKM